MAGVSGQGTTFNLPNYVGELFAVTPQDTPLLSMIGGLTGGEQSSSALFEWQGYDLRDADYFNRQRLEGADAPTGESRVRFNVTNVCEIHQETVDVSYTKLSTWGQYASTGSAHTGMVGVTGVNPVTNEEDFQIRSALAQMARDVEKSFLVGVFNNPSTNATPRRTRGLLPATTSNVKDGAAVTQGTATIATDGTFTITAHTLANGDKVVVDSLTTGALGVLVPQQVYFVISVATNTFKLALTLGGSAITFAATGGAVVAEPGALTESHVLDTLQLAWENGGIQQEETAVVMANGTLTRALTKIFVTDKNYQEQTRNVGGVSLKTIITDFGTLSMLLNRHMPTGAISVVSAEELSPVFLNVPGKGFLFQEPLSKTGSANRSQIYGEIGLKYGNEKQHALIKNVALTANP